jgi:hypothetical protein
MSLERNDGATDCVEFNECLKAYTRGGYDYPMQKACDECLLYKKRLKAKDD